MNKGKHTDVIAFFSIAQLVLGIFIISSIQFKPFNLKYIIEYFLVGMILIFASMGLFKLKNFIRLLNLLIASLMLFVYFYIMIRCILQPHAYATMFLVAYFPVFLLYIAFLIYFTRPKIKELYKNPKWIDKFLDILNKI